MGGPTTYWTLVQHSGFVHGGKPMFERGLEEAAVENRVKARQIVDRGGIIVATYSEAAALADDLQYGPDVTGLTPCFDGGFNHQVTVAGRPIAVPRRPLPGGNDAGLVANG